MHRNYLLLLLLVKLHGPLLGPAVMFAGDKLKLLGFILGSCKTKKLAFSGTHTRTQGACQE